jgi:hypothetical protein
LFRLSGSQLVPVRVFVQPDPTARQVLVERSLITAGDEHVFAIRSIRGRPNASVGDFRTLASPQAIATVFSRTFRAQ